MTQFFCKYANVSRAALASVGPDWKYFFWAPLSGVCRNV